MKEVAPRENRIEFYMEADISDGNLVCQGAVSNLSRKGLMISNIPKPFDFYSPKWIAIVNGAGKNFKLLMKPRWSTANGKWKDIGCQIISPSLNWIKFINELDDQEIAISDTLH